MTTLSLVAPDIRQGTPADLAAIGRLFSPPKSDALLKWLLDDSRDGGTLRSFVAVADGGEIVGHIGYTVSTFTDGQSTWRGVYPIVWKVQDNVTGPVGLRLLTRVLKLADFSFIIGGSAAARKLYPALGYRQLFTIPGYRKILKLRGLGGNPFSRSTARTLRMRSLSALNTLWDDADDSAQVSLEAATGAWEQQTMLPDNRMANVAPPAQLRWAAACPTVEAHLLTLTIGQDRAAPLLCYVRPSKGSSVRGTIVHIPHLGADGHTWSAALRQIEEFLASRGCAEITVLGSDPTFEQALKGRGFALDRTLPFWFRGTTAPPADWYLTLLEGDLGFRK